MNRKTRMSSLFVVAALFSAGQLAGCGAANDESSAAERMAALAACHLNDGTVDPTAEIRACDPQDVKKTTICHIPPGNPANAHTLCVGNAAVPAHVRNHGDPVGPCVIETPCPPPTGTGGAGGSATGGTGGGTGGAGGAGGDADAGMPIIT